MRHCLVHCFLLCIAVFLFAGCSNGGGGSNPAAFDGTTGQVAFLVKDQAVGDLDALFVTIERVELIGVEQSFALFEGERRENLLDFREHEFLLTLRDDVPAGIYDRIRIQMRDPAIEPNEELFPVRLAGDGVVDIDPGESFEVVEGRLLVARIDFDVTRSVEFDEEINEYIISPVILVEFESALPAPILVDDLRGVILSIDLECDSETEPGHNGDGNEDVGQNVLAGGSDDDDDGNHDGDDDDHGDDDDDGDNDSNNDSNNSSNNSSDDDDGNDGDDGNGDDDDGDDDNGDDDDDADSDDDDGSDDDADSDDDDGSDDDDDGHDNGNGGDNGNGHEKGNGGGHDDDDDADDDDNGGDNDNGNHDGNDKKNEKCKDNGKHNGNDKKNEKGNDNVNGKDNGKDDENDNGNGDGTGDDQADNGDEPTAPRMCGLVIEVDGEVGQIEIRVDLTTTIFSDGLDLIDLETLAIDDRILVRGRLDELGTVIADVIMQGDPIRLRGILSDGSDPQPFPLVLDAEQEFVGVLNTEIVEEARYYRLNGRELTPFTLEPGTRARCTGRFDDESGVLLAGLVDIEVSPIDGVIESIDLESVPAQMTVREEDDELQTVAIDAETTVRVVGNGPLDIGFLQPGLAVHVTIDGELDGLPLARLIRVTPLHLEGDVVEVDSATREIQIEDGEAVRITLRVRDDSTILELAGDELNLIELENVEVGDHVEAFALMEADGSYQVWLLIIRD